MEVSAGPQPGLLFQHGSQSLPGRAYWQRRLEEHEAGLGVAAAGVVAVFAFSVPAATAAATACSRPASSWICARPALMDSTTSGSTSQPTTSSPLLANCAASGSPILPSPTTATDESLAGCIASQHSEWLQGD